MPGSMHEPAVYGAKIIGLHPGNAGRGRPAVQGFVTLFDRESGEPLVLMDGTAITAIRTGAASALAARVLARESATSHGILGTGGLATWLWSAPMNRSTVKPIPLPYPGPPSMLTPVRQRCAKPEIC